MPEISFRDMIEQEVAGYVFAVDHRNEGEEVPYSDEPFMEQLKGLDLFDSIIAAPDPTGEAVAVRGDNVPCDCGEHPTSGKGQNDISSTLAHVVRRLHQRWIAQC